MRYKDDWPEARERLAALWEGRCLDRPCISVTAPSGKAVPGPEPPASPEAAWLDPGWVIADLRARLANTHWGGEAIPSYLLLAGWVVCYGATPRFASTTIWHEPVRVDWDHPPSFRFDPGEPWFRRHLALYQAVLEEAGRDDFLVGRPVFLPGNDLLALILGHEQFFLGLHDHPEWMKRSLLDLAEAQAEACRRLAEVAARSHDFWYGNAGWMPFWAPEPYLATQADVSCMLSPEMYEEFVLPEVELLGRRFGKLWYHLDGRDARQHLPRLCSLPYLRVIQYTPSPQEPPNGPEHLDLYRTIQRADKIVHIPVPPQHIEPLVKSLDPGLLCLDTWVGSAGEARELLTSVARWSRPHR